jgi:hypothetical protein
LENQNITSKVINHIREVTNEYSYHLTMTENSINEDELEEIQGIAEQIIEKLYRDWMAKRKQKSGIISLRMQRGLGMV